MDEIKMKMQCQICGNMVDDSNEKELKKHSLGYHLRELERKKEKEK